jgi:mono/diheme cytochrome c family protein/DNA-binding beta-propeller fold protein YncE
MTLQTYISRVAHIAPALALALGATLANACTGGVATNEVIPSGPGFAPADAGRACVPGCSPPAAPSGTQPVFAPTVTASNPPPPVSGGTLLVTHDGSTAVASDPDRDAVYVVDVAAKSVTFTIALQPGDEPGRLAEDGAGRVHVALRSGGALVTIDPKAGSVLTRRAVCPAPRGVAWDASSDLVWVACATGELVALPSAGGAAARSWVVERDLRDVVVQKDGSLAVTKFRSAQVLRLGTDGSVSRRDWLGQLGPFTAQVAWRTIAGLSAGSTITVYQEESTLRIPTNVPGGYSGIAHGSAFADGGPIPPPGLPAGAGSIVRSTVTSLDADGKSTAKSMLPDAVLPVDVALSPDGSRMAVASAGTGFTTVPTVWLLVNGVLQATTGLTGPPVVAVAFAGSGDLLAQTQEPADLWFLPSSGGAATAIHLSTVTREDTGHDIFHAQAGGFIACASCHPEGGDDGHVWLVDGLPRRTPSLRGTIAGTAPYHWPGDEMNMPMLIDDIYTRRMGGGRLTASQQGVLTSWVERIPAPPAPSWVDVGAAQRGQSIFAGAAGCVACHSGPKFTNNATMNVGTGKDTGRALDGGAPPAAFQVPPLVGVGWRTPLLHDGCALTIADRFGKCATPQHGSTANLSAQDVTDLSAYLETL